MFAFAKEWLRQIKKKYCTKEWSGQEKRKDLKLQYNKVRKWGLHLNFVSLWGRHISASCLISNKPYQEAEHAAHSKRSYLCLESHLCGDHCDLNLLLSPAWVFQLLWRFWLSILQSQVSSSDLWAPWVRLLQTRVRRLHVYMEIEHWSVSPQWEQVYGVV